MGTSILVDSIYMGKSFRTERVNYICRLLYVHPSVNVTYMRKCVFKHYHAGYTILLTNIRVLLNFYTIYQHDRSAVAQW